MGKNSFTKRIGFLQSSYREEHEKEMDARVHKSEHKQKGTGNPQDQVDSNMKNFGDNF